MIFALEEVEDILEKWENAVDQNLLLVPQGLQYPSVLESLTVQIMCTR